VQDWIKTEPSHDGYLNDPTATAWVPMRSSSNIVAVVAAFDPSWDDTGSWVVYTFDRQVHSQVVDTAADESAAITAAKALMALINTATG
jgi:hypothetical protein